MTADRVNLAALLTSDQPGLWTLDQCWAVFRHILDKEGPLPGIGAALDSYGIFHNISGNRSSYIYDMAVSIGLGGDCQFCYQNRSSID